MCWYVEYLSVTKLVTVAEINLEYKVQYFPLKLFEVQSYSNSKCKT